MKTTASLGLPFYQSLGHLFYAMAAIDNNVRDVEIAKVYQSVHQNWLQMDNLTDAFGEDAAHQIEIVFHWLEGNVYDPEDSFKAFTEYYKEHTPQFTNEIKNIITKTTSAIAASFSGLNKAELGLMAKLSLLFKK